jgi:uncharacterized protein YodC (DUF2158 family)
MEEQLKDGGPAFPVNGPSGDHPGMTLRDWFAGQIVIGLQHRKSTGKAKTVH